MVGVIIWTISILLSSWFVLGGFCQVYTPPSTLPVLAASIWFVVLAYNSTKSTKKDSFR